MKRNKKLRPQNEDRNVHQAGVVSYKQQWADTLLYVTAGLLDNVTCF
jgi:hypothetical protein